MRESGERRGGTKCDERESGVGEGKWGEIKLGERERKWDDRTSGMRANEKKWSE